MGHSHHCAWSPAARGRIVQASGSTAVWFVEIIEIPVITSLKSPFSQKVVKKRRKIKRIIPITTGLLVLFGVVICLTLDLGRLSLDPATSKQALAAFTGVHSPLDPT